ncbi:hypothetical protein BaRGS_00007438, partial [Batillaria attramentaria]
MPQLVWSQSQKIHTGEQSRTVAWQLVLSVWSNLARSSSRRRQLHTQDAATCPRKTCPGVREGMLNVHLIPHSHVDVGWVSTADEYYTGKAWTGACVRCVLETTLPQLLKNPDRRFIFMEMAFFSRWWNEVSNRTRQIVADLVKQGRLEIVNGGWVMSDAAVTYYNDIIDQHTLGFDFVRGILGTCAQSRVAWHVDQFGHSREHAAIFAQMGFDALFLGRIDFQDLEVRRNTTTLEFVWDTNSHDINEKGNLFTHVLYDGYYPPPGFNMDGSQVPFGGDEQRILDEFLKAVTSRASAYGTQHLLITMGCDFGYRDARTWFPGMDKLISLVNAEQKHGSKVNVLYSTPSCYIQHVNHANLNWTVKRDDFLPYATAPGDYWTGFFTSRPGQKLFTKRAGSILQSVIEEAYNEVMKGLFPGELKMAYCPGLNISQCAVTETSSSFLVTVYNPLSRPVPTWLRLPVTQHDVQVEDSDGQPVPSQLLPVPNAIRKLPQRSSESDTELVFRATLPPHGYTSFLVTTRPESDGQKSDRRTANKLDVVIKNKYLKVTFDGTTGLLKEVRNLVTDRSVLLSQDFAYYASNRSEGLGELPSCSGAYVFSATDSQKLSVGNGLVDIRLEKVRAMSKEKLGGPLVQEVHQQFSPWVSQVVRLYNDSRHLELQWIVGPTPTETSVEVVSLFKSDIESKDVFYTDSNGREIRKRRRDQREGLNATVVDPIAGNYYPITSRIYIQGVEKDVQLTILPDRPQGGSSLKSGHMELMVHRHLICDDKKGVLEILEEMGPDGEPITYTGKHYLFVDTPSNSVTLTRQMALDVHFAPTLTFTKVTEKQKPLMAGLQREKSFLRDPLPPNIQVLTLDYVQDEGTKVYLLRLEHIYEAHESKILSVPASVSLKQLFTPFDIRQVEEVALGGIHSPNTLRRLRWRTVEGKTNSETI